jgi:hypothetical protein
MSDHPHPQSTRGDAPPTAKQERYLRTLAEKRGVSFVPPRTRTEASRAIRELLRRRPDTRADQARDRRAVQDALAKAGDDARVSERELEGYGSSATWSRRS